MPVKFNDESAYYLIKALLSWGESCKRQEGKYMNQSAGREAFPIFFFIKTLLFQYILTGVLLLVLAFMLYKLELGERIVSFVIIAIYVVATFFGGVLAGKRMENRKFLWGLLVGGAYFLLLTVASAVLGEEGIRLGNSFWTTLVLCVGGGMLGGMVS